MFFQARWLLMLCLSLASGSCASKPQGPIESEAQVVARSLLGELNGEQFEILVHKLKLLPSPCNRAHSLLYDLSQTQQCRRARRAMRYLVDLLIKGYESLEIDGKYEKRYLCKKVTIPSGIGVSRGNPDDTVSLVEFSDFQCEQCKQAQPKLIEILKQRPEVRLVFLNFPIVLAHPLAPESAAAALAAGKSGRFWEFHDWLFANQERISRPAMLGFAKELGLNVNRFAADMEVASEEVQSQRELGIRLGVNSTPTFFINGCLYSEKNIDSLSEWVIDALPGQ